MRIYVTGAGGFAGRWLRRELEGAAHEVIPDRSTDDTRLDVRDASAVAKAIAGSRPDAIVHLAAMSASTDAAVRPHDALAVTVGGTVNLLEAVRQHLPAAHVLVVGSSEVYGEPGPDDLPLTEESPLRPKKTYALTKVAQESVALAYAAREGLSLAVVRPFNHTGPGQRPAFVVPAVAARILDVRRGRASDVAVGNIDVRRDFSDVRDVVRAYRLLLEALAGGRVAPDRRVFNVCRGESVAIRQIVEMLARQAGIEPAMRTDVGLVRQDDPADIVGDASALSALTGWRPEIPLRQTLRDLWRALDRGPGVDDLTTAQRPASSR